MINRIKTSGVVRESADISSTRIRMDSLCVCLFVWLNRTVSLPVARYLVYYCVTSFFISYQATTRLTAKRIVFAVPLPASLRILSIVLSSHREYSPILEQHDVHDVPFFHSVEPRLESTDESHAIQMRPRIHLRESS